MNEVLQHSPQPPPMSPASAFENYVDFNGNEYTLKDGGFLFLSYFSINAIFDHWNYPSWTLNCVENYTKYYEYRALSVFPPVQTYMNLPVGPCEVEIGRRAPSSYDIEMTIVGYGNENMNFKTDVVNFVDSYTAKFSVCGPGIFCKSPPPSPPRLPPLPLSSPPPLVWKDVNGSQISA